MEYTPHFLFSPQMEANLRKLGLKKREIDQIKKHQEKLCEPNQVSVRLRATPRVQHVLLNHGITGQETMFLAEYLDDLTLRYLEGSDPAAARERRKKKDTEAKAARRAENREDYNAKQVIYQREYRARQKARKEINATKTAPARLAKAQKAASERQCAAD